MSKTHKTNAAYRAWKKVKELFPASGEKLVEAIQATNDAHKTGQRYGNQRKMRAEIKVQERRLARKKNKRLDLD